MERAGEGKKDSPHSLLGLLMAPLVRFCFRQGLTIYDFEKVAKGVFIRLAADELERTAQKVNTSRISVLTGIYRRDVDRILNDVVSDADQRKGPLMKVIGQWERDRQFLTKGAGTPRVLSCDGDDSEFFQLVRKVTRHVHPSAVLFEIQRNGAAIKTPKGLKLVRRTNILGEDFYEGFKYMSQDIEILIKAGEENLGKSSDKIGHLQHRTEYDNVYVKHVPEIQRWILEQGRAFHKRVREYVSSFDKDINPLKKLDGEPSGTKVMVSSVSFIELPRTGAELE